MTSPFAWGRFLHMDEVPASAASLEAHLPVFDQLDNRGQSAAHNLADLSAIYRLAKCLPLESNVPGERRERHLSFAVDLPQPLPNPLLWQRRF